MRVIDLLRKFGRDPEGGVAIMFGMLIMPMMLATGLAIEVGRLVYVQNRLSLALDASALAGAKYFNPLDVPNTSAITAKVFYANFPNGYMDVTVTPIVTVTADQKTIFTSAEAQMPTIFGVFAGVTDLKISAASKTSREMMGLNLALVLDTTGSMASNNKIGNLRTAAKNLLDQLYGTSNTRDNTGVSIVPFVATVNIGNTKGAAGKPNSDRRTWVTPDPSTLFNLAKTGDAEWKGCVKAYLDPAPDQVQGEERDDPPSAARKWPVYFAESTNGVYPKGDNDWTVVAGVMTPKKSGGVPDPVPTVGPNRSCGLPIYPMINDKEKLKEFIETLQPVNGGGTIGNLGLAWGWRTISAKWKGFWDYVEPADDQKAGTIKAVVFMTDGVTQWYDEAGYAPVGDPSAYETQAINPRYNSGTVNGAKNEANAVKEINNSITRLCTLMKKKGIEIYTVVLQVNDNATQNMYKQCASASDHFFDVKNVNDLSTVFGKIGKSLNRIRIVQ